jgi:hypothetical protein
MRSYYDLVNYLKCSNYIFSWFQEKSLASAELSDPDRWALAPLSAAVTPNAQERENAVRQAVGVPPLVKIQLVKCPSLDRPAPA